MATELFHQPVAEGEEPCLIGSRCRSCGSVSFPPRPVCIACGLEEVERLPVGRYGRIKSSAVVHNAPIGFAAPYVIALVALEEGPPVFCPIKGSPEAVPAPGTAVELVIGPARPGGASVIQYRLIHSQ